MSAGRRAFLLVAIGVLSALIAGCSATSSPAGSSTATAYGTGPDIVAALAGHGVQCVNPRERQPSTNVKQQLGCQVDGQDVLIWVFNDGAARDRYVQAGAAMASQLGVDLAADAPARVVGPTWIVVTDTPELAARIQGAIGGEIGR